MVDAEDSLSGRSWWDGIIESENRMFSLRWNVTIDEKDPTFQDIETNGIFKNVLYSKKMSKF